jgi:hypothetical protein
LPSASTEAFPHPLRACRGAGRGNPSKHHEQKPIEKMKLTRQEKEQIEKALSVYIEDRYELADNSENKEDREFFRVEALEAQDLRERVQGSIYQ